jgi:MFS superfamily sulfate permease-like transporter
MTDRNDITVRRREGVPWWGWLIALVLIALLVWWLLTMNSNNGGTTPPPTIPASTPSLQLPSGSPSETMSPDASPTAS